MSPILPSQFQETISSPTATLCGNFVNTLLRFPTLFYQWFSWAFNASGEITPEFRREIVPTGDLIFSASNAENSHRILCNGQAVDRTTYATLFGVIGILYGPGNGTTTFNVPDYRARFPVGVGTFAGGATATLATVGGEDEVELTIAEAGLDHIHVTGRFNDDSGIDGDDVRLIPTDTDMNLSATAGRRVNGEASYGLDTLGDQDGKYTVTSAAIKTDATPVTPAAHNNLPPFLPCYILIAT